MEMALCFTKKAGKLLGYFNHFCFVEQIIVLGAQWNYHHILLLS